MRSFSRDARIVCGELDGYLRTSVAGGAPVIRQEPLEQLVEELGLEGHAARGDLSGEVLGGFLRRYLDSRARTPCSSP